MCKKMSLLITMPDGYTKEKFLTDETMALLDSNFNVTHNTTGRAYTKEEL